MDVIELTPVNEAAVERDSRDETTTLSRQMKSRHRFMLVLSVVVIAIAFLLRTTPQNSGGIRVKWLPDLPLPELCGSRLVWDIECPGCGLTRSFVALAEGNLSESLRYNRVGWVLALATLAQVPFRLYSLSELRHRVVRRQWPRYFGWALIAMLITNWLVKHVSALVGW